MNASHEEYKIEGIFWFTHFGAMSIIREEIAINFQPYPKTTVRCPVAACTFFAEHPYDAELGNLNRATDFALRAVEIHLIQHRVLGNLRGWDRSRTWPRGRGEIGTTYGAERQISACWGTDQHRTPIPQGKSIPVSDEEEKEENSSEHCEMLL